MEKRIRFSVIMSVYEADKAEYFIRCFDSITKEQLLPPDEIVLVVDGPVSDELRKAVHACIDSSIPVKLIELPDKKGLGNAMRMACAAASYDWIARMDADDIAVPERFLWQVSYLSEHENVDIIGGDIAEFIQEGTTISYRIVPRTDKEIRNYMKSRCPLNHMTVMMRKEMLLRTGGYLDWPMNEDYYLWVRMALTDCVFSNIGQVLVNARIGEAWYERRGGKKYFESEIGIQKYMLHQKVIGPIRFCYNFFIRFLLEYVFSSKVRQFVYKHFARKEPSQ